MGFQLVVVQGRSASQVLKVGTSVMTVGRMQECQLRIASSQVSRKHCQIFEKKGLLLVKDLGSSNGTLVNGKKIADQRVLEAGDELTIGSVKFRVERLEDTVLIPGTKQPPSAAKPGDTAVSCAIAGDGDDDSIALEDEPSARIASPAPPIKGSAERASEESSADDATVEISEDAVANYLLDIELDDEDKL